MSEEENLQRCLICQSDEAYSIQTGDEWQIVCFDCDNHTASYKTKKEAADEWNKN